MGSSAYEIEREIRATRDRLDVNLNELEGRAATNAVRYGRVAAIAAGVGALGIAAYFIWRRTHRPTLRDRLEGLSLDSLRELADEVSGRLKAQMPSVTVRVNEQQPEEPGTVESILRKVAPAVLGTASTAVLRRVAPAGEGSDTASSSQADS